MPKAAFSDLDAYRRERLYTEDIARALVSKIDGFRALFHVRQFDRKFKVWEGTCTVDPKVPLPVVRLARIRSLSVTSLMRRASLFEVEFLHYI